MNTKILEFRQISRGREFMEIPIHNQKVFFFFYVIELEDGATVSYLSIYINCFKEYIPSTVKKLIMDSNYN